MAREGTKKSAKDWWEELTGCGSITSPLLDDNEDDDDDDDDDDVDTGRGQERVCLMKPGGTVAAED